MVNKDPMLKKKLEDTNRIKKYSAIRHRYFLLCIKDLETYLTVKKMITIRFFEI